MSAALTATEGLDPQLRAAAVSGAAARPPAVPAPSASDAGWLWRALVLGLLGILVVALGGIIFTVADGNDKTSPDVLVTIFSSALTGLIGLYVKSPD